MLKQKKKKIADRRTDAEGHNIIHPFFKLD